MEGKQAHSKLSIRQAATANSHRLISGSERHSEELRITFELISKPLKLQDTSHDHVSKTQSVHGVTHPRGADQEPSFRNKFCQQSCNSPQLCCVSRRQ